MQSQIRDSALFTPQTRSKAYKKCKTICGSPDVNSQAALCGSLLVCVSHTHDSAAGDITFDPPTQTHQCLHCLLQPQLGTRRQGQQRRKVDASTSPNPPTTRGAILTRRGTETNLPCFQHLQNDGSKTHSWSFLMYP